MQRYIPIETPLGFFYGRDCIFLSSINFENRTNTLVLKGVINGNLCTRRRPDEYLNYRIRFQGVLALKMLELDSWDYISESSFDEVVDSDWIDSIGGKATARHRHILLQTYDDVFEVVCENVEFAVEIQNADQSDPTKSPVARKSES
jgi:hypothetical protein